MHADHDKKFRLGQTVHFNGLPSTVSDVRTDDQGPMYLIMTSDVNLPLWIPEQQLNAEAEATPEPLFNQRSPHLVVVDSFLRDPDALRALALRQTFHTDQRQYKGKRTQERFLWPSLREEFERLLHIRITDWLAQPMNGVFQITGFTDPLVWHHDTQDYAAALYFTPDAPLDAGTSFWRLRATGSRRPATHVLEASRFADDAERERVNGQIYDQHNLLNGENWELCDRVGAVYNRLVLWDAKLIHSASSYDGLSGDRVEHSRLVQLFFFSGS